MKQLANLQNIFQECVLHDNKSDSTSWVSASGRAAPEIQLSIYTHAYSARLKEVLANDYPAILMAMGDDSFNKLADDYIQAHPSHYFSLRDFGQHIPNFASEHYKNLPWLTELAIFEWTLGQAFDAATVDLFTEEEMATIPPEVWPDLKFNLHPSLHRLDLEWNIVEMWQALTADEPTQIEAVRGDASPWIIWREQLTTRFRSIPQDEQIALDATSQGDSFNDVCEALSAIIDFEEIPLRAAGLLKSWIAQGLLIGANGWGYK